MSIFGRSSKPIALLFDEKVLFFGSLCLWWQFKKVENGLFFGKIASL